MQQERGTGCPCRQLLMVTIQANGKERDDEEEQNRVSRLSVIWPDVAVVTVYKTQHRQPSMCEIDRHMDTIRREGMADPNTNTDS